MQSDVLNLPSPPAPAVAPDHLQDDLRQVIRRPAERGVARMTPVACRPRLSALILFASDLLILLSTLGVAERTGHDAWAFLLLLLAYAAAGLYPGLSNTPSAEIRRLTIATTATSIMIGITSLLTGSHQFEDVVYLTAIWGVLLIALPLGRVTVRQLFSRKAWWGYPVVILGAGQTGKQVIKTLLNQPEMGLKPVAVLDDDPATWGTVQGVPVCGALNLAPHYAITHKVTHAIVAMPGLQRARLMELLERDARFFPHMMIIPNLFGLSSLWVTTQDLNGMLGLSLQRTLLNPWRQAGKRVIDFAGSLALLLVLLPVFTLIGLLIKLEARGPVFFAQYRLGKGGRCFKALKFRSMYPNAQEKLRQVLDEDPELRQEYETYRKLRNDPRVTRVGKVLRKYSLDELPQLINVLMGQMSLVGPRAYMPEELPMMLGKERTILRALPGITGLWQVSGRNGVTFEMRLALDVSYISNWSVWLDVYLLARTIPVVLTGRDAY